MAKTAEKLLTVAFPKTLVNFVEAQTESPGEYLTRLVREDRDRKRDQLEDELVAALDGDFVEISEQELQSGEGIMAIMKRKIAAGEIQQGTDATSISANS
jgi:Arc/MetJ-type ribon-helix-helix transcriptional regulator